MQGKVVVITGAFGVLGSAAVEQAKARGAKPVAIDFAPAPGDAGSLVFGGVNLADENAANAVMARISEEAGRIDALLNIAGGFTWAKIEQSGADVWTRMATLNLATALNASKAAMPHLIESNGAIVNVGANGALRAGLGMGPYAASKQAVHKLTESLAEELKGKVRVNAVLPSILDTPQNRKDMPNTDPAIWVQPADLANVMLFLASDEARAVTGALVPVTGRV